MLLPQESLAREDVGTIIRAGCGARFALLAILHDEPRSQINRSALLGRPPLSGSAQNGP